MKKNYIAPELVCVRMCTHNHILTISQSTVGAHTVNSGEELGVKGQSPSYNVWDDDWSN